MLDSFRKRSSSLISTFLIVLVAAVMALWGIERLSNDRTGGGGGIAAWVNGEAITRREFAQQYEMKLTQYQAMMGGQQIDDKMVLQLQIPQRTLEELIQYKLLAQQADKLGIRVPDPELADHIRALPYYQKDGKFNEETYLKTPNRGLEEKSQRERLRLIRYQNYLVDRVRLTPMELDRAYTLRDTKFDLEYAKIEMAKIGQDHVPSAKEVDAYFKTVKESDLKQYYDSHRTDFVDKAKVEMKQIRVGIPFQASDAKKAEAKKKIEDIAKEVTDKNFSDTAKMRSDDEYAKKGGVVGWVDRGTLEPALDAAVDKLELGKISAPIETQFGYFIVLVTQKKEEVTHPLAEVKKTVASKLLGEEQRKKLADEAKADLEKKVAEGKPIDADLKRLKVDIKKTGPFSAGTGFVPQIGQADSILDAIFELTLENPVPKKLIAHQDGLYYIKLKSIERPKEAEAQKNREVVEKSIVTAFQSELMNTWVTNLQKKATVKTEIAFEGRGE